MQGGLSTSRLTLVPIYGAIHYFGGSSGTHGNTKAREIAVGSDTNAVMTTTDVARRVTTRV